MTWQKTVPVTVKIASTGGPLTDVPTWQTVTTDTIGVTVGRGRSERLSGFSAGTCELKMKSLGRKFDPDYSGRLTGFQLGRQVWITATDSYGTYDLFRGHIDSITTPFTHRADIVTLGCLDLLAELAQMQLADSAHAITLKSFTPLVWWRFNENGVDSSGNGNDARILQGVNGSYYTDPLGFGGSGNALTGVWFIREARPLTTTASSTWSVQFLVRSTGTTSFNLPQTVIVSASNNTDGVGISIDSNGKLTAIIGAASVTADRQVFDGATHHILGVRNGANAYLYVDGVLSASSVSAGATTPAFNRIFAQSLADFTGFGEMTVVVDEVALFGWAVDASSALTLAQGALTGWAGDRSDERIDRLATLLNIPAGRLDLEVGSTAAGPMSGGSDVASYFQSVAAGENGRLFVPGNGKVTFQAKTHDLAAALTATFVDSVAGVRYQSLAVQQTRQKVTTTSEVSGVDCAGSYTDGTASATFGERGSSTSTQLSSGAVCASLAQHIVSIESVPATRPGQWAASVGRMERESLPLLRDLLSVDIGDKVSVSRTPMGIAPAVASTVAVEQITYEIDPGDAWDVRLSGVTMDMTSLFQWGTSTWNGSSGWGF